MILNGCRGANQQQACGQSLAVLHGADGARFMIPVIFPKMLPQINRDHESACRVAASS
jgi:hypothetical protein